MPQHAKTNRPATAPPAATTTDVSRLVLSTVEEVVYKVAVPGDDPLAGIVEFVGGQVEKAVGYRPEDFVRDSSLWFRILHPDDAPGVMEATQKLVRERRTGLREYRLRGHDGEYRWFEDRTTPLFDGAGKLSGFVGAARDITERKRREEALRELVAGTAGAAGNDFFRSAVKHLATALRVQYAFVGELVAEGRERVRVLGFWTPDGFGEPCEYDLAGTPCEKVVGRQMCYYPQSVYQQFPEDEMLRQLGVESYLGVPLFDSALQPLGVIGVLHDRPLDDPEIAKAILGVFATRSALELERQRAHDMLQSYADEMRQLSRRLIETQETERRRIALGLHDEIGQMLTTLKLTIESCSALPAEEVIQKLLLAEATVGNLLTAVRNVALELRPSMLDDLGLLPALTWLCEGFTTRAGLRIDLAHEGLAARRFAPRVESAAYRIVQEALTNVARHAGVKQATMQAWADADLLQLQVQDAGRGFDVNVPAASGHATGLCGMRERVNALAGHITIESTPGKGTCISIALPLPGVAEVQGGDQNPVGR